MASTYDDSNASTATTPALRNSRRDEKEKRLKRHNVRMGWYQMEHARQRANRFQMAIDERYYDNIQYTAGEEADLIARGQAPVVNNEVAPIVDFMLGTERRMRVDNTVSHRTDDSPEATEEALAKQQLLKFVDDLNQGQVVRSTAADDQYKAGLGWTELYIRPEGEYPIGIRFESWRNVLHDSVVMSRFSEDWRYLFRFRELDMDIAEMMFDRRLHPLLHKGRVSTSTRSYLEHFNGVAVESMDLNMGGGIGGLGKHVQFETDAWVNNPRDRVLLIECQSADPYRDEAGSFSLRKRHSIMTMDDTLIEAWTPFNHNRFTLIPRWCYRRKEDGAPYGMIRRHRSRQDALNKLESKAIFRMSVRQVMLEEGALDDDVMDIEQLQDRITDPGSVLEFASGAITKGKVKIVDGTALAQADIALAERYVQAIRSGGVSIEDRGQDRSDVSGKARAIRRDQSSVMIAEPLDNSFWSRQAEGEILLSLCEQYHVNPMTFAAPGRTKSVEYVRINQADPQTGVKRNDISRRKASFILGEQPWKQDMAESAFESLTSMMGELAKVAPNVVISILDIVFDLHPALPKKGQILARIRQATGMTDPDEPESEAQQQAQQQKQAMAQAQYEAEMAQLKADIAEAQAKGLKLNAEAMAKRLETLYMAAQAADVLTQRPQIAPVADELARSVGFQDGNGDAALGAPVPTMQQGMPGAPMQQQPQIPEALQADGGLQGIETPAADGLVPQGEV